MRNDRASHTAMAVTMLRALETERPAAQRICEDPLAKRFISPWKYALFKLMFRLTKDRSALEFVSVRTRYIDDCLKQSIEEGVSQLVILGAGYDSRAYRFAPLLSQVSVFEVDHPATQAAKRRKLSASQQEVPENVQFVPIDFDHEGLEKLLKNGFEPKAKSLFIWEGVSCYLREEAIDQTLAFIARCSVDTRVVFDYVTPSTIELFQQPIRSWQMKLLGEEVVFGINGIEEFLAARGFKAVESVGGQELRERYSQGRGGLATGYGIAQARVK